MALVTEVEVLFWEHDRQTMIGGNFFFFSWGVCLWGEEVLVVCSLQFAVLQFCSFADTSEFFSFGVGILGC